MEMGVDSGSKGEAALLFEGLKYFISELLLLSILVFEKFILQSRRVLCCYYFVSTQDWMLNLSHSLKALFAFTWVSLK